MRHWDKERRSKGTLAMQRDDVLQILTEHVNIDAARDRAESYVQRIIVRLFALSSHQTFGLKFKVYL